MYFYTQIFTVTSYVITGVDEESRVRVERTVQALSTQKLYRVFPSDKIFTYSSRLITASVREVVQESASIKIRPVGLHTIKIEVTLLKPIFRINDSEALTEDGIIFSSQYDLRVLPRITIASSTVTKVERDNLSFTQLVSQDTTHTIETLPFLSDISTKISSIIFPVTHIVVERTGEVSFFNEQGTSKVIILQDSDMKKTWSTLVSAIDTDPLKSKLANDKKNLEYLDVRYGNKVFYKFSDMTFQNSKVPGILHNHASTTSEITTASSSSQ